MGIKLTLKTLFILLIFLSALVIFRIEAKAEIVEKTHNRTFEVKAEYVKVTEKKTTQITESGFLIQAGSKEGFTIFNPIEGDPEEEDKIQKTKDSIKVTNQRGREIDFELVETNSGNYIVEVNINEQISTNNSLELNLEYNSYGLLIKTGAVKDVYIPGFPSDYDFESNNTRERINTRVLIPNNLENINFISPTQEVVQNNNEKVIQIPQNDLVGRSTWIQIGNEQFFNFSIKQEIPKTSDIPFAINTFTIPVPRDISSGPINQRVYFTNISPEPFATRLDEDGNLLFEYKQSAISSTEVIIEGYATLTQSQNFNVKGAGNVSDIPSEFDRYLLDAEFWEVDSSAIRAAVTEIGAEQNNVDDVIQKTYDFVIDRIDYSFVKKYGINERQGALATLNGGAAVCMEYSDLFITLLRAQGIPARAAFGFGFGSADYEARQDRDINHQWAEVYLPNQGTWINIDTTWGEFGNELLGGDLNHFYSHVASVNPETPSTSEFTFFGSIQDGFIPERDMEINILEDLSQFGALQSRTQQNILDDFPNPQGLDRTFQNISIFDSSLRSSWGNFLDNSFGLNNQAFANITFTLITLLPFLLAGFFVIKFFIKRRKRAKLKELNRYQVV